MNLNLSNWTKLYAWWKLDVTLNVINSAIKSSQLRKLTKKLLSRFITCYFVLCHSTLTCNSKTCHPESLNLLGISPICNEIWSTQQTIKNGKQRTRRSEVSSKEGVKFFVFSVCADQAISKIPTFRNSYPIRLVMSSKLETKSGFFKKLYPTSRWVMSLLSRATLLG